MLSEENEYDEDEGDEVEIEGECARRIEEANAE